MSRRTTEDILATAGPIAKFVRTQRKKLGYTQSVLAERTGLGLRFIRELERGKKTLRLDKVNELLSFFGYELLPSPVARAESP